MLKAAHVDIAKVEEVNDTSYDPTLLIHGRFDGLQAYQSNEPLTLKADGDKFNEFLPSSYGVSGTFNVQVVNQKFLADHARGRGGLPPRRAPRVQLLRGPRRDLRRLRGD